MSDYEPPSARYRRLAVECLEVGSTFPLGDRRTVLLQMAQVWQRLADEYQGSTPPLRMRAPRPRCSNNSNASARTTAKNPQDERQFGDRSQ
jgi:hypothetical protein